MTRSASSQRQALTRLLAAAIVAGGGEVPGPTASKEAYLQTLLAQQGLSAVVDAGRSISAARHSPVVQAITRVADPAEVLWRWKKLERFGHMHHRTREISHAVVAGVISVRIEHFSLDGTFIHPASDLLIWGVIMGLMEVARRTDVSAMLVQADRRAIALAAVGDEDPSTTSVLELSWKEAPVGAQSRASQTAVRGARRPIAEAFGQLVRQDPLHQWTVAEASRRLAVSTRTLQRELAATGETFTEVTQRNRLEHAVALMGRPMTLTDVAYCCGFSDPAHFSRQFRAHYAVPPSAYKSLTGPTRSH